jgi:hypothetical protein
MNIDWKVGQIIHIASFNEAAKQGKFEIDLTAPRGTGYFYYKLTYNKKLYYVKQRFMSNNILIFKVEDV